MNSLRSVTPRRIVEFNVQNFRRKFSGESDSTGGLSQAVRISAMLLLLFNIILFLMFASESREWYWKMTIGGEWIFETAQLCRRLCRRRVVRAKSRIPEGSTPCLAPFCRPDHAKCGRFMRKAPCRRAGRRLMSLKSQRSFRKAAEDALRLRAVHCLMSHRSGRPAPLGILSHAG